VASSNADGSRNPLPDGATRPPHDAIVPEQDSARKAVEEGRALPLDTILDAAGIPSRGEVLDAHLVRIRGLLVYELLLIQSSVSAKITTEYFYATTGKRVRSE
jgi:uncharacterized membrane protein YkoI